MLYNTGWKLMECAGSCVVLARGDKLLEVNRSQDASARQLDSSKVTLQPASRHHHGRSHRPETPLFIPVLLDLLASGRRLRRCASRVMIITQKTLLLSYDNDITKSSVQRFAPGCVRHRGRKQGQSRGKETLCSANWHLLTVFLHPFDPKLTCLNPP